MKRIWLISFILLVTAISFFIASPYGINFSLGKFSVNKKFDLKLGLDLAGGSQLVFEADMSKISEDKKQVAIQGVRDIIERRVNLFGVSEPTVQTSVFEGKQRVIVELPGIKDTQEAVNLIGKTAQLMFSEVKEIPSASGATPSAELTPTDLTGADLESAEVVFDSQTGKPAISIKFTADGGNKFAEITGRNIQKPIPIVLDGQIVSAPTVQEKITGGQAQISGSFTIDEAKQLSIQLNAGALPVPVKLIQETTVGATLGADSIKQSVTAGIVGFVMVVLFMILAYGWFGVVASVGLIIFGLITLALYKLIPVTVTLPGIAGFLLSVGMALDGNILIFERFKEEKLKREFSQAIEMSFGRAWNSIRDAYVATLITCFILANPLDWSFLNVSGPVRGFAITLALGIAVSLFTGIFISRNLIRIFIRSGSVNQKKI